MTNFVDLFVDIYHLKLYNLNVENLGKTKENWEELRMRTNGKIEEIYKVIKCEHKDPFSVLGMHVVTSGKKKCVTVRAYLPYAKMCYLIDLEKNEKHEMELIDEAGFFEIILKDRSEIFKYKNEV